VCVCVCSSGLLIPTTPIKTEMESLKEKRSNYPV